MYIRLAIIIKGDKDGRSQASSPPHMAPDRLQIIPPSQACMHAPPIEHHGPGRILASTTSASACNWNFRGIIIIMIMNEVHKLATPHLAKANVAYDKRIADASSSEPGQTSGSNAKRTNRPVPPNPSSGTVSSPRRSAPLVVQLNDQRTKPVTKKSQVDKPESWHDETDSDANSEPIRRRGGIMLGSIQGMDAKKENRQRWS